MELEVRCATVSSSPAFNLNRFHGRAVSAGQSPSPMNCPNSGSGPCCCGVQHPGRCGPAQKKTQNSGFFRRGRGLRGPKVAETLMAGLRPAKKALLRQKFQEIDEEAKGRKGFK